MTSCCQQPITALELFARWAIGVHSAAASKTHADGHSVVLTRNGPDGGVSGFCCILQLIESLLVSLATAGLTMGSDTSDDKLLFQEESGLSSLLYYHAS